jgi:hypothetical protein
MNTGLQLCDEAARHLALATQWPRFGEGGAGLLDKWLSEHDSARFVAIDSLAKVRPREPGS